MTEPNFVLASTGAALTTIATLALGPVLGEYVMIMFAGLLGCIVALTEQPSSSWKGTLAFLFRGTIFSLVFTGIITSLATSYIGQEHGVSPYMLLAAVSFSIGWTSNKWERIKDWLISLVTKDKQG